MSQVVDARASELVDKLQSIKNNINSKAKFVAVSKTFPSSDILSLYRAGHRDFGENRVQELEQKASELAQSCPDISWHFLGRLQSNKISKLLKITALRYIHSVDSFDTLNSLIRYRDLVYPHSIGLFLQVNTSGEQAKAGFAADDMLDLQASVEHLQQQGGSLSFSGLMTMGSIRTDNFTKAAERCFVRLQQIRDQLRKLSGVENCQLSMGMSQDYQIALAQGSDWLRLGSVIFGLRNS